MVLSRRLAFGFGMGIAALAILWLLEVLESCPSDEDCVLRWRTFFPYVAVSATISGIIFAKFPYLGPNASRTLVAALRGGWIGLLCHVGTSVGITVVLAIHEMRGSPSIWEILTGYFLFLVVTFGGFTISLLLIGWITIPLMALASILSDRLADVMGNVVGPGRDLPKPIDRRQSGSVCT